jgi:hypothetical protein
MRTAEELFTYFQENRYGPSWSQQQGLKHFQVVANALEEGETVLMTFVGQQNYVTNNKHEGYFAYAITDKRLVMGQKHPVAGDKLKTLPIESIQDLSFEIGMAFCPVTVKLEDSTFNIGLEKQSAEKTCNKIKETLATLKK